jgi:hypothetical protein
LILLCSIPAKVKVKQHLKDGKTINCILLSNIIFKVKKVSRLIVVVKILVVCAIEIEGRESIATNK